MLKGFFISFCIVVFRYFFSIRKGFALKWHIVVIALMPFISISAIVFYPCNVEAFNQTSREIPFKIIHSSFESRVFFFKDIINSYGIFRPVNRGWIKPFKFISGYVLKFSGSDKISNAHVSDQTNNSRTQENNYIDSITRQREQQIDEICHRFLFWSFIGFWLAVILAHLK